MSEAIYKEICNQFKAVGRHFWFCNSCISSSMVFKKQIDELNKRVTAVESTAKTNTENISNVTKDVEKVTKDVEKLQEERTKDADSSKREIFAELSERTAKKNNIVMHSVAEPDPSIRNGNDRKAEDLAAITDIGEALGIKLDAEKDIKFSARIGPRDDKADSPRPLLIGFRDTAVKEKILAEARHLKNNTAFSHVGIVPDLTKQQRKEESEMRDEAEKRNENMDGEESLNYEWRLVGPKGEKRLQKLPRPKEGSTTRGRGRGQGRGRGGARGGAVRHTPRTESLKRKETESPEEEETPSQRSKR